MPIIINNVFTVDNSKLLLLLTLILKKLASQSIRPNLSCLNVRQFHRKYEEQPRGKMPREKERGSEEGRKVGLVKLNGMRDVWKTLD